MGISRTSTQSAAERRSAETELGAMVERFAPEHARLISVARRSLRKRLPSAHELVYEYRSWFVISFSPSGRGYEGLLGIRGSAEGVRLFFNGAKELADPEKLLRGSGSQVRSIDLENASVLKRPAVVQLIEGAIALSRVPFEAEGRGAVVIQSSPAKKKAKTKKKTKKKRPGRGAE